MMIERVFVKLVLLEKKQRWIILRTTKDSPNDGLVEVAQPPEETEQHVFFGRTIIGMFYLPHLLEDKNDDMPEELTF
jgi:hypothetical protein